MKQPNAIWRIRFSISRRAFRQRRACPRTSPCPLSSFAPASSFPVSPRELSKNRATWPMGIAPSSTSVLPPTLTARARGVEPGARAFGAGHASHERLELVADRAAGGTAILGKQLVGNADPFLGMRPDLAPVLPAVDDHPIAGPIEPCVPRISHRGRARGP